MQTLLRLLPFLWLRHQTQLSRGDSTVRSVYRYTEKNHRFVKDTQIMVICVPFL